MKENLFILIFSLLGVVCYADDYGKVEFHFYEQSHSGESVPVEVSYVELFSDDYEWSLNIDVGSNVLTLPVTQKRGRLSLKAGDRYVFTSLKGDPIVDVPKVPTDEIEVIKIPVESPKQAKAGEVLIIHGSISSEHIPPGGAHIRYESEKGSSYTQIDSRGKFSLKVHQMGGDLYVMPEFAKSDNGEMTHCHMWSLNVVDSEQNLPSSKYRAWSTLPKTKISISLNGSNEKLHHGVIAFYLKEKSTIPVAWYDLSAYPENRSISIPQGDLYVKLNGDLLGSVSVESSHKSIIVDSKLGIEIE